MRRLSTIFALLALTCAALADLPTRSSVWTNGPYVAIIGDSISEGYPGWSCYPSVATPNGDPTFDLAHLLIARGVQATNFSYPGAASDYLRKTTLLIALKQKPKYVLCHVGVNNIALGTNWSATLSDLNLMAATCQSSNATLIVEHIFPWTDGDDTENLTVRTWNTNLTTWASTSAVPVFCFDNHDAFGQVRISTGQYDDIKTAWDNDGVHLKAPAYGYWASNLYDRLELLGNWFVDVAATGTQSGRSWVNAYTNFGFSWASMAAGDIVYVAKGTYPTEATIDGSGISNAPLILKVGQEASKIGTVNMSGVSLAGNWITIDGASSDAFWVTITNTVEVGRITNNILLRMTNGIYGNSGRYIGFTIKWVDITTPDLESNHGIRLNPDPNIPSSIEILYNYIHNVGQDGINWTTDNDNGYDKVVIHHNLIDQPGDDGIENGGGATIHHNRIQSSRFARGHPDAIQSSGNWHRIYNNIFYDFGSSLILMQGQAAEGGHYGNIQFYGNECYYKDYPYSTNFNQQSTELEFKWYPASEIYNRHTITYTNWLIANNTFAYLSSGGVAIEARQPWAGVAGTISNVIVRDLVYLNNLFYQSTNSGFGIPFGMSTNSDTGATNSWAWSEGDVRVDYSVLATNGSASRYGYFGSNFYSGEALAAQTAYKSNWSTIPILYSPSTYDFRPSWSDSAVLHRGTNLAAWNLPGWTNDLYGRPRGSIPSIGASEPDDDPNLLVWLRFEDNFTGGNVLADSSGHTNSGHRFGYAGSAGGSNFPVRVAANTTAGANSNGYAGDFKWYGDGYGFYDRSGDYAALTNDAAFNAMTQATFSVWARYHPATRINATNDYTADANATLLSAGTSTGEVGTWDLQRFNASIWLNNTRFLVLTNGSFTGGNNGRFVIEFPDRGYDNAGDTTNWHHYAVTWDTGVARGYFDGAPISTNTLGITTLTVGANGSNPTPWIGVGCNTHGGTPALDDEAGEDYPNHGWFNGVMDDVRIYNRTLSAAEIAEVYAGGETSGGGTEPPPYEPPTNKQIRPSRMRAGLIQSP